MSEVDHLRYPVLETIDSPDDLKALSLEECRVLADEIRAFIVDAVTSGGTGHLGSNLGIVEVTLAMHRVFSSPRDVLLFDTGHQAYVHKLVTDRRQGFARLRKEGGLSGYPSRAESEHDWIENSHASTALSYAHGLATAFKATGEEATRRVVVVVGDGALTGGMAYEALNNLGHSNARVCVILNDNGRSYAPTISRLSESLTQLRLNPSFSSLQSKVTKALEDLPGVGHLAGHSIRSVTAAVRELIEPQVFFEALGVRYTGPIDGHDIGAVEHALKRASAWPGPIVLHVLTRKGRGYGPAEEDDVQCLHDYKASQLASPGTATDHGAISVGPRSPDRNYTEAFSQSLLDAAANDERIVAITAAMPSPTGLLSFAARYPSRFIDVGIAESHAMTSAAGMALGGLKPVVAIYSTFLSRCFDQENLDVGLHGAPVVICADRAGITGDDGPSHHGILDIVLGLAIPDLTIFAPAEPAEVAPMLQSALELRAPALIRYPKTPGPAAPLAARGMGLKSRVLREGSGEVLLAGFGKLAAAAVGAAELIETEGVDATVIDPRLVRPICPDLLEACLSARLVVTAEDGLVHGGAGQFLRAALEREAERAGIPAPAVVCLGVPTRYLPHAAPDAILAQLGLDSEGIALGVRRALSRVSGDFRAQKNGAAAHSRGVSRSGRSFGGGGMVAR